MPWDLATAISHAHRVLSWQENLQKDEIPPQWMWPFEDELDTWFEEVERARNEKYGINKEDDDESGSMMSNEYAQGRK